MPNEDKTFSGFFVLDLRFWWRQVHTLDIELSYQCLDILMKHFLSCLIFYLQYPNTTFPCIGVELRQKKGDARMIFQRKLRTNQSDCAVHASAGA